MYFIIINLVPIILIEVYLWCMYASSPRCSLFPLSFAYAIWCIDSWSLKFCIMACSTSPRGKLGSTFSNTMTSNTVTSNKSCTANWVYKTASESINTICLLFAFVTNNCLLWGVINLSSFVIFTISFFICSSVYSPCSINHFFHLCRLYVVVLVTWSTK